MSAAPIVGVVVPSAEGTVPPEAKQMYPSGVEFISTGLGLQSLSPRGYDAVIDNIVGAAQSLASQGAASIAISGTSLTFYRGASFHEELKTNVRDATGLPVTTMSTGVVEGLRTMGVRRVAVGTAYIEEVNARLRRFLTEAGFDVLAVEGLGIDLVGRAGNVPREALLDLGQRAFAASPGADGILISCGGLRTLNVTVPLEAACGVPVISSTPAAFWSAVRLVGHDGTSPGYGRLFEPAVAASSAATAS
jgi:arylmalonate decarboxylase